MLSAEIDANGWAVIIAAVFVGLLQLATLVLNYLRDREKLKRVVEVADKVEAVRQEALVVAKNVEDVKTEAKTVAKNVEDVRYSLVENNVNQTKELEAIAGKIAVVINKIEEVHKAPNGGG